MRIICSKGGEVVGLFYVVLFGLIGFNSLVVVLALIGARRNGMKKERPLTSPIGSGNICRYLVTWNPQIAKIATRMPRAINKMSMSMMD